MAFLVGMLVSGLTYLVMSCNMGCLDLMLFKNALTVGVYDDTLHRFPGLEMTFSISEPGDNEHFSKDRSQIRGQRSDNQRKPPGYRIQC